MLGNAPPYALETFAFSLPALATSAGYAPLDGDRELVLGMWMAARLVQGMLPPVSLSPVDRATRAERARHWLGNLAVPQPARMAILRAFDASAMYPVTAADALSELAQTLTGHLDDASQQEVAGLVARLRALAVEVENGTSVAQFQPGN